MPRGSRVTVRNNNERLHLCPLTCHHKISIKKARIPPHLSFPYPGTFASAQYRKFLNVALPEPHAYTAGRTSRNPPITLCCMPEISADSNVRCHAFPGTRK